MRISDIKERIGAMLEERQQLANATGKPSAYWQDFAAAFRYMMDLSEESFEHLRLHTYHLTGDNYQTYYLGGEPERFRENLGYDQLTAGLPERCILEEPSGGIGYHYPDGRFLSSDIVRFQRVVRTLATRNVFDALAGKDTRRHILEIGGGYGGLAHHVHAIVPASTYVIVDIPETLLFSSAYLSQHNPEARIYLYDRASFGDTWPQRIDAYDFMLLPNYRLADLGDFSADLAINVESLQEMTSAQVDEYLRYLSAVCAGPFYSWNLDRNASNMELDDLSARIGEYFRVVEILPPRLNWKARVRSSLREAGTRLGMTGGHFHRGYRYREYLCYPKHRANDAQNRVEAA